MPVPEGTTTNDTKVESKNIQAKDFKLDQKLKLKVSDVNMELMPARDGKPARNRFILSFLGKEKGFVLNATNQGFIEARLGSKPNAWIGAEIVLHRTTTPYEGQVVPAFRLIECHKGAAPPQSDSDDSDF